MAFVIVEFEDDEGETQRVRLEVADRWDEGEGEVIDTLLAWMDDDGRVHEEESEAAWMQVGALCYADGTAAIFLNEEPAEGDGRWRWAEEVQG